ncbi:MAG: glycosyltransferase family 2 protein [Bacteroidaceae bacterium]|nr:glycosyltransferase family 2 protein [Bacteroidaceae bacterium]
MISIIIPVYNVSAYLSQCLESVLNQTYKDLEIILVDDGSKDNSGMLCDEYASKDSRIKVIHKVNGGLSDARNVGTAQANGSWIFYLDSDDWMANNTLETLLQYAEINNCDAVQGGLYYAYPDHLLKREEKPSIVLNRNAAMKELIINDRVKNFAWGKLYKTALVKDLQFPKGKYFEDCYWQHLVIDRVNRYGIIDTPLLYYRQRPDSISGTISNRYDDLIQGYEIRMKFIQEHYPQFSALMQQKYEEVREIKYPKTDVISKIKKLAFRIKERVIPSIRYEIIKLN